MIHLVTFDSERSLRHGSSVTGSGWLILSVLSRHKIQGWGALHDRQICWKVQVFLVQCPLLKSPHIGALGTLRLVGLGCCELSLKGEQGQLS